VELPDKQKETRNTRQSRLSPSSGKPRQLANGASIAAVCQKLAISEQTFHRWRNQYGGMKADEAKRLRELEAENARLKRAVADLTLDKVMLQEVVAKKS
jgi:transposase-like protein